MTPKLKAKELLWEFLPLIEGWTDNNKTKIAASCAVMAAKYTLNELASFGVIYPSRVYEEHKEFWQEVIKELESF